MSDTLLPYTPLFRSVRQECRDCSTGTDSTGGPGGQRYSVVVRRVRLRGHRVGERRVRGADRGAVHGDGRGLWRVGDPGGGEGSAVGDGARRAGRELGGGGPVAQADLGVPGGRVRGEDLDREGRLVAPRQSLSHAAQRGATDRVEAVAGTPASRARQFGVTWSTGWAGV